jgi:hypothetical protein
MTLANVSKVTCRLGRFVCIAIIGGLAFWLPNLLVRLVYIYLLHDKDVPNRTIFFATLIGLPFISACVFRFLTKREKGNATVSLIAFTQLLGIWVLGPLFCLLDASFSGGGFAKPGGMATFELMTVSFPVFTFIGSTYDGTLGAVVIATICLFVYGSRVVARAG